MKIRDLKGDLHMVEVEDLYIKPVYGTEAIKGYAICSNLGNEEVEIVSYTDHVVAKHMLRLFSLYDNASKGFACDVEACCMSEVDIARDLWLAAGERLRSVTYKVKVGEN